MKNAHGLISMLTLALLSACGPQGSLPAPGSEEQNAAAPLRALAADPNAGERTQAMLNYLKSLPGKTSNKVLSGQFAGYPNVNYIADNSFDTRLMQEVYNESGEWPAIIGTDYTGRLAENVSDCRRISTGHNQKLIDYYKAGGLVTITAHFYRPDNHGGSQCGLRSSYALARILPGGVDRAKWLAMLDQVAAGLAQLRDNGVPVLWRPLHESPGSFWWDEDAASYKRLWQDMFNYFTTSKGLHNLIWVYTGTQSYYPGDAYVDLMGDDIYSGSVSGGSWNTYNFALNTAQKPYAVTEFGSASGGCAECASNYDFSKLIAGIKANFPKSTYFLVWSDTYRLGNPSHFNQKALMDDPWVVDRSEVSFSPR
ncbi:glycosyl hydrolase [Deinococcus planocerae]|uniref:glycosyl hydrolase n=1 Tax=Deinococcus planocerae TaxID=1737569 RepID=UPI0011AEF613|nr:glycosyl hydrolase [Deinococcus planocerae]